VRLRQIVRTACGANAELTGLRSGRPPAPRRKRREPAVRPDEFTALTRRCAPVNTENSPVNSALARIVNSADIEPMRKKKIRDRLQLLNDGRSFYLEFLRNLTPQIALLTVTFLLGSMLDFTRIDLSNWLPTFACFVLFGAFVLAFYVNAAIFYERLFSPWKAWRTRLERLLTAHGFHGYRRVVAKLRVTWRFRFVEFLELLAVFYFFTFALVIVMVMSMFSVLGILRTNHVG
jgi:hypothetical protein